MPHQHACPQVGTTLKFIIALPGLSLRGEGWGFPGRQVLAQTPTTLRRDFLAFQFPASLLRTPVSLESF